MFVTARGFCLLQTYASTFSNWLTSCSCLNFVIVIVSWLLPLPNQPLDALSFNSTNIKLRSMMSSPSHRLSCEPSGRKISTQLSMALKVTCFKFGLLTWAIHFVGLVVSMYAGKDNGGGSSQSPKVLLCTVLLQTTLRDWQLPLSLVHGAVKKSTDIVL